MANVLAHNTAIVIAETSSCSKFLIFGQNLGVGGGGGGRGSTETKIYSTSYKYYQTAKGKLCTPQHLLCMSKP